jgi:hypothetical protein
MAPTAILQLPTLGKSPWLFRWGRLPMFSCNQFMPYRDAFDGSSLMVFRSPVASVHIPKTAFLVYWKHVSEAISCVPATSLHARFPPVRLSGQTIYVNGAVLRTSVSQSACKTDGLAGSSDQACLFAASRSLVWATAMSHAEIIGNADKNNPRGLG